MDGAAVDIVADVKYALRRLKQSLGFTATVVVMLALGIGATTAVFTLIQQVMLRSLVVARPQQHFGPALRKNAGVYEIVGVAANVHYFPSTVRAPERPMYFLPEAQSATFDDRELESREVWSHYLYNVVIWAPGNPPGLAVVGLYGVTAYGVEQRTGEIGVRMALGADRGSVVAMIVRAAFLQVGIGLTLGIPAAIFSGRLIASHLFGVRPWDPALLLGATLLLVAAALLAAIIPARRAAGVDPMQTLRSE